jgi:hypothetical protein
MIAPRTTVIRAVIEKDVRLYWPVVALIAVVCAGAWVLQVIGLFSQSNANNLQSLAQLASAFLMIAVVQQDPASSDRHDWLIRPIRKLDLLLAKAIFIVLFTFVPLQLAQAAIQLTGGMEPAAVLQAFAADCLTSAIGIPAVITFAVLTRTLVIAIAAAIAAMAVYIVFFLTSLQNVVMGSSVRWIVDQPFFLAMATLGLVSLWLAYRRREMTRARAVFAGGVTLLFALSCYVPAHALFAAQQALSGNAEAASGVTLTPVAGCIADAHRTEFSSETGDDVIMAAPGETITATDDDHKPMSEKDLRKLPGMFAPAPWAPRQFDREGPSPIVFTTRVQPAGVPAGGLLIVDDVRGAYVDAAGRVTGAPLLGRRIREAFHHSGLNDFHENWLISERNAAAQSGARLRLDYDLTLLTPTGSYSLMPGAKGGRVAGLGDCALDKIATTSVSLIKCTLTGPRPALITTRIAGGPEHREAPNYAPGWLRSDDPVQTVDVNSRQLTPGQPVTLTAYRVAAHFQRRVLEPAGATAGASAACS